MANQNMKLVLSLAGRDDGAVRLLAETERNYIESALRLTHGNVSQAARLLGINRTTLYNRMESFAKEP